jgi:hypothetical protein
MHQKFISENLEGVILFTAEVSEDSSSLSSSRIEVGENFSNRFNVSRKFLDLSSKEISSL